jgi:hypothetical protein
VDSNVLSRFHTLLICLALAPVCQATSKVGEFLEPKSIRQLVWAEEHVVFFRVHILSSTVVSTGPSACQYVQVAAIEEQIRGSASGQIEICSDRPQMAGSEYLVGLYPGDALSDLAREEIVAKSGIEISDSGSRYVQKPLWEYRIYTIHSPGRTTTRRVVVPSTHLSVPKECVDKTERRVVEFSDDEIESEYVMLHIQWNCFVSEARASKPSAVE